MGALAVIDEALDKGRVTSTDPGERELQEIALALRADAPEPDPAFASALHERAAAGFPHQAGAGDGGRRAAERVRGTLRSAAGRLQPLRPRLTPRFAGAVAAVVFGVAVAGGVISQTVGQDTGGPITAVEPAGPAESQALKVEPDASVRSLDREFGSAGGAAPAGRDEAVAPDMDIAPVPPTAPPKQNESLRQQDRQVERSAFMTLAAPEDKLADAAQGVADVARRHGGFVLSSSMTTGEKTQGGGQFELRVPVNQLDATIDDLSDLGEVRSLTQDEQDVTSSFESLEDQLKAALAERNGLLNRLENATTDAEAASLRRQLRQANRSVNGFKQEQRQLAKRVSYAAVSVTLQEGKGNAGSSTTEALDDALEILTASLGIFVRIVAVLIPLSLAGLLVWFVARAIQRRRRESALD
jgi:hypothetical protein